VKTLKKQSGYALLVFVSLMLAAASAVAVKAINNNGNNQIARDKLTAAALAQAKEALIGYALTYSDTHLHVPSYMNGYLPNPDLGPGVNYPEGSTAGSSSKDISKIGKLPWRELGLKPLSHGNIECIWYVISGRFKNQSKTDNMNWDTLGQIDVLDANGNTIASNLAALIIAPGKPLDGQSRYLIDVDHTRCGGNYDAHNYLDAYNAADAISGEVNYFTGSTNNSSAPNTNNKRFILASNNHFNDQFLFVTAADIFKPIIRRTDFRDQISALLNDSVFITHLKTVGITSGNKGSGHINCDNTINSDNKNFCKNWQEMLLLTQLPSPSSITIDGAATASCNRVLIFGGQQTAGQVRLTAADKDDPANYLEAPNRASFAVPVAAHSSFSGSTTFSADNPSADLLRCIP